MDDPSEESTQEFEALAVWTIGEAGTTVAIYCVRRTVLRAGTVSVGSTQGAWRCHRLAI